MANKKNDDAIKKWEDMDIGALVVSSATTFVKNRPVGVSMWVLGLLLAAFANGFSVSETAREAYTMTLQHAEEVGAQELAKAQRNWQVAEDKYYNVKGWFGSCDNKCQKALDKRNMAKAEVDRIQGKRDQIMTDARREVGIWSVFGVRDIRNSFWTAWQQGKDFAKRYTMMDAMFMMIGGKEETAVSMILKLVMQYIINLTMGLITSFFFFLYGVYGLIVSYGESAMSGLAFFLLVLIAGMATIGTYLMAIYGTVAGGGVYLMKQAAKQQALHGDRPGGAPRRVQYNQYGGGMPGGMHQRPGMGRGHYD